MCAQWHVGEGSTVTVAGAVADLANGLTVFPFHPPLGETCSEAENSQHAEALSIGWTAELFLRDCIKWEWTDCRVFGADRIHRNLPKMELFSVFLTALTPTPGMDNAR